MCISRVHAFHNLRGWTTVLLPIITVNVALINAGRTVNRIVWESSNLGVLNTVNVIVEFLRVLYHTHRQSQRKKNTITNKNNTPFEK